MAADGHGGNVVLVLASAVRLCQWLPAPTNNRQRHIVLLKYDRFKSDKHENATFGTRCSYLLVSGPYGSVGLRNEDGNMFNKNSFGGSFGFGNRLDNPVWSQSSLVVELWPSPSEITISQEEDLYLAGLHGFYDSHKDLERDLSRHGMSYEWFTHLSRKEGKEANGFEPPTIVELVLWLGTSGVAVGLYKALDLWVKKVNGRKIKVKFDDIEIEATQLTEEQFEDLLLRVIDYKEQWLEYKKQKQAARDVFSDFSPTPTTLYSEEKTRLQNQYSRTRAQLLEERGFEE